ncbi:hypothetical protein [Hyphococcus sp.]|uniref:hypothetical protein n=1 Tax=Hyphococcus sp. TaxID=2038636 RepID=UPI00207D9202|nr:MAG: hypothetical protein DHS20C04_31500 [Marinicaulis sp.]
MIDIASAIFAIGAAGFWFWSSTVSFEKKTTIGGLDDLGPKLRSQSRRSAYAAICAGVAALLQVLSFLT